MTHKETKVGIKYGKLTFVYERVVHKEEPVKQIEVPNLKALTYNEKKGGNVNVYA